MKNKTEIIRIMIFSFAILVLSYLILGIFISFYYKSVWDMPRFVLSNGFSALAVLCLGIALLSCVVLTSSLFVKNKKAKTALYVTSVILFISLTTITYCIVSGLESQYKIFVAYDS